ncbi:MAG: 5'-methylthioadenosine nucleosidase [Planctomycetaceae bacterium]|nr:5'-methylthioadenosine nucleosidase [Planctomycetaceae bacterium]
MSDEEQSSPEETRDLAHADVGIVTAIPMELNPFIGQLEKRRSYTGGKFKFIGGTFEDKVKVVVVQQAVGFAKARTATQALIDAHTPDWVLSAGYSGALQPEMGVGDIVVGNSICDQHGHTIKIDMNMEPNPKTGLRVGRLLTADELVLKVDDKRKLGEEHQAIAVDLESLAVAQVCKESQTRFMAIRSLSDDMSEDLPKEILSLMGETGTMRLGAAVGAIWNRASSMKDMWHLREKGMHASRRLAAFLNMLLPKLVE